jgi:hypothetical protein
MKQRRPGGAVVMSIETERTEGRNWRRVRSVAAGFIYLMAIPLALALGHVQSKSNPVAAPIGTGSVPASIHEAQSGVDIGPGSDEGLLAKHPDVP